MQTALPSLTSCRQQRPMSLIATRRVPLNTGFRAPSVVQTARSLEDCPMRRGEVYCMRHRKKLPKLNRPADQRKAMLRAMTTEIIRHGKITTTVTKAKACRKWVDKMVQLAKNGSLHSRRQAAAWIYDKDVVRNLFAAAPDRYGDRDGGYCRIIKEDRLRRGDAAEMAVIELV
eukprot:CAMPEP_0206139582 /NCGR_PEP_ID=MMETSP1473-20131121/6587_1 /ASSEMBLY_ACC=CAM_ASM_001109 /TAXON_ID=1461547 /ORGANISM="Stichococcus sp, Strain RCC1054" /LENGTH=172 /DNA_ID=CAMNT_0053533427 /DNA_START=175 /DNA_END=693 /DNA_ORIENTATION=-